MKRVRCPKCDHYLTFDETRYTEGQTLVFECPECHRQFGVRIDVNKLLATRKDEKRQLAQSSKADIYTDIAHRNDEEQIDCGALIVIENVFHYKQTIPLQMGENIVGRYVKGSNINAPIETVDPSIDTTHCIITVSRNKEGDFIYILRDATPDGTGTFVGNTILGDKERLRIEDGTIITIGATTMILRAAGSTEEETTAESR